MNKIQSSLAVLLSCLCLSSAYAYNDGPYMGAELGGGFANISDGLGGRLMVGEQFNPFFALEVGGTAIPNAKGGWVSETDDRQREFYSGDLDGKLMLPIGDHFNFFLKAGPSLGYFDGYSDDSDKNGTQAMLNAGTGININFTRHISADAFLQAFDQRGGDIAGLAGVGLSYHFSDDGHKANQPVVNSSATAS